MRRAVPAPEIGPRLRVWARSRNHRGALSTRLILGIAILLAWVAFAAGNAEAGALEGEVELSSFHTSDLFPTVETRHPTWGLRGTIEVSAALWSNDVFQVRLLGALRTEAYESWQPRNLHRWTLGTELRGRRLRFRVYGRLTNGELSFPAAGTAGAILDRRAIGADFRLSVFGNWRLQLRSRYEWKDFVPAFDERDAQTWIFRTGVERRWGEGRILRLSHEYRRAESVTDLHSYEHNAIRVQAIWPLGRRWSADILGAIGLRNYRTGQPFALNFARSDDRSFLLLSLRRFITDRLRARAFGEWKRRRSTVEVKSYSVFTVGIGVRGWR